jgi:hypothetical protein
LETPGESWAFLLWPRVGVRVLAGLLKNRDHLALGLVVIFLGRVLFCFAFPVYFL